MPSDIVAAVEGGLDSHTISLIASRLRCLSVKSKSRCGHGDCRGKIK